MKRLLATVLLLVGCGDDGCPAIGSGPDMLVSTTVERLSGDCATPTSDEISRGLISLGDDCFDDGPGIHGPSADYCEYQIITACETSYGSFRWGGRVRYAGDRQHDGEVTFFRYDVDGVLLCEGTYLATFSEGL